jgi:predicted RNase H-like HicB family nuclease
MLRYSVKLSRDTNGTLLVDVPGVPEAHTFGESRAEALFRAVDAVETPLMGYIEDRRDIPAADAAPRGAFITLPGIDRSQAGFVSSHAGGQSGQGGTGPAAIGTCLKWTVCSICAMRRASINWRRPSGRSASACLLRSMRPRSGKLAHFSESSWFTM